MEKKVQSIKESGETEQPHFTDCQYYDLLCKLQGDIYHAAQVFSILNTALNNEDLLDEVSTGNAFQVVSGLRDVFNLGYARLQEAVEKMKGTT